MITPELERAARACCLTTCCATDCLRTKECHAINLGSEVDRATAVLRSALKKPSEEVLEAVAIAISRAFREEGGFWDGQWESESEQHEFHIAACAAMFAAVSSILSGADASS